jgi:hypothetical protein
MSRYSTLAIVCEFTLNQNKPRIYPIAYHCLLMLHSYPDAISNIESFQTELISYLSKNDLLSR